MLYSPGGGVLPIMAHTGRLCPKGVLFSGFRYVKGKGFHKLRYTKGKENRSFRYCRFSHDVTKIQTIKLLILPIFHFNCLFSNCERLGTSLQIMGLATIDPHSHKMQTKLYKIPKFGVSRPKSKQDTAIWKCQKIYIEMYGHLDAVRYSVRMPYISLLILMFLNRCISVKTSLFNTKLGIFWISVCSFWLCGSIVANPII